MEIKHFEESRAEEIREFNKRILRDTNVLFEPGGPWDADLDKIDEVYVKPGGCFVFIEESGAIIAMGALKIISESEAEVKRMRVETSLQRRGIGQKLLDYLTEFAKSLGVKRIILNTSELQAPAQRFYEKNGYSEYRRANFKREHLRDMEIIFYEKNL